MPNRVSARSLSAATVLVSAGISQVIGGSPALAAPDAASTVSATRATGMQCAVYSERQAAPACFDTFAELLGWVGFVGVAPDASPDQFLRDYAPVVEAARAGDTAKAQALSTSITGAGLTDEDLGYTPGYFMGGFTDGGALYTHWSPNTACNTEADSLADTPQWDNRADQLMNGICGRVKAFDSWNPSNPYGLCNNNTILATGSGSYGTYSYVPADRTSCLIFAP